MSVSESDAKERESQKETSTFLQVREIFESLAVALFLAFLFKTFEAEAFVIPTGSMAPTLMGRHKDVVCSQCGYRFQTSASVEIDAATNRRNGLHVVAGVCPQCGFTQYYGDEVPTSKNDKVAPSFTGDRILVSKMTFDQRALERWDVSVFRSPSDPKINYIKRIVGLPNENLRVQYGDLFVQKLNADSQANEAKRPSTRQSGNENAEMKPDVDLAQTDFAHDGSLAEAAVETDGPFEIARKDYKYLRQIMQVVYDDDYYAENLRKVGWPECWSDDLAANSSQVAWAPIASKKKSGFQFDGNLSQNPLGTSLKLETEADVSPVGQDDQTYQWLRYRHIVPSSKDWYYLSLGQLPPEVAASGVVENNPCLINDFAAYNAGISRRQAFVSSYGQSSGGGMIDEWDRAKMDEYSDLAQVETDSNGVQRVYCKKNPDGFGCNWVGDLAVSCDLTFDSITSENDKLAFDLVKGGVVFRCEISPKDGKISLAIPAVKEFEPKTVDYEFKQGKTYEFTFINVDEEMRVVINDKELVFPDNGGRYDDLTANSNGAEPVAIPRNRDPNARDLAPVAIGARGAAVRVESLKVLRDVYYIAAGRMLEDWDSGRFNDFNTARCDRLLTGSVPYLGDEDSSTEFFSSPSAWEGYGNTKSALLTQRSGQYVAFGDNSGFSLDSRLWADNDTPHYVDRKYLIGKAFYVYWPHGWPLPIIKSPFWPNFADMRHID